VAGALQAAAGVRPVRACVVLLPYEMQISEDAARTYKEMGFTWEPGFEAGSTQQRLMAEFGRLGVPAFDARQAFAGQSPKVGETFVYDRGDKIDWNHPNRKGHQLIAAWLSSQTDLAARCLDPVPKQ
jgi:lysophospholipase L1-like esterase